MRAEYRPNRRLFVLGAMLIQLGMRAIYARAVFTSALKISGWSKVGTKPRLIGSSFLPHRF